LLEREIAAIQELLDEQPDSKCMWFTNAMASATDSRVGCMESIVHYKRLLLKSSAADIDSKKLIGDCVSLLQRLRELDPARRRRYLDLGRHENVLAVATLLTCSC